MKCLYFFFFFSSRRRHTRCLSDWSSDVCSSDLVIGNSRIETRDQNYDLLRLVRDGFASARRGDELLKQALREQVIRHALRMPLHSHDPVGIAGPFHTFDRAIRSVSRDAEFFPRLVDRLM